MCKDFVDWVAAVASLGSAIFVGVQAWYTRAALKKNDDSLAIARSTLEASQDSTRAAAEAARSGAALLVETTKQRIDARMGRISVILPNRGEYRFLLDGESEEVSEGAVFAEPRDSMKTLRVEFVLTVSNQSASPMSVSSNQYTGVRILEPKGWFKLTVSVTLSVHEWWLRAQPYLSGYPDAEIPPEETTSPIHVAFFTFDDGFDFGGMDSVSVECQGSVLNPVPGEASSRCIGQSPASLYTNEWQKRSLTAFVEPAIRTYYRSKARGDKLE